MFKKGLFISLWMMGVVVGAATASLPVAVGSLSVDGYWVRSPAGPNTAAYLTIANTSGEGDKLVKVECPDAAVTELHNNIEEDGIMKMRPVPFIEIGKDGVEMKPGGLHVMLMGLRDSFKGKETVPLTLHFEKAGTVDINFPVKTPTDRVMAG